MVIVEGIPGSEKATLSRYTHDILNIHKMESELFLEGNLLHPADFESVACMPNQELDKLRSIYFDVFHYVDPFVSMYGNDSLIAYELANQSAQNGIPSSLYEEIRRYEIYDGVSVEKYCDLMIKRWKSFVKVQREKENMMISAYSTSPYFYCPTKCSRSSIKQSF
ncbi:hypothetical protein [Paenibacillus sp. ISL-20]|uniref:hypothetical protein n=1 Tax=Paenibacillus sp. ISL-20 TaxID=2819163 RepID=UPI0020363217|nr:hypothetical protein [Paenibacillus sp. ISL-20]